MNLEEQALLHGKMNELAGDFCRQHGIPTPPIKFERLRRMTLANYGLDWDTGKRTIFIDVFKRWRTRLSLFESLFHELTHHWQRHVIGKGWYLEYPFRRARLLYPNRIKRLLLYWPKGWDLYYESDEEVEARSFARSLFAQHLEGII